MTHILSIILPTKDAKDLALKTYISLKDYIGDDVELVIQDHKGSSGLKAEIGGPNVTVIEEDDFNIPDAVNKAVAHAKGKYLLFWGAGETAIMPAFGYLIAELKTSANDIVFNSIILAENGSIFSPQPELVSQGMVCVTPGAVISKELFDGIGGLNTAYPIATDYDMFVRMLNKTNNYKVNGAPIVTFSTQGTSSGPRAFEGYIECELIRMRNYAKHPALSALDMIAISYTYLKQQVRVTND